MVAHLDPTTKLSQLFMSGALTYIPKNTVIQSTDEKLSFSLIKEGYVKRYSITNEGTQGVQIINGPGDIFPLTLIFKEVFDQVIYSGPEIYYYETVTAVKLFTLEVSVLKKALEKDHEIYIDLLRETGKRLSNFIMSEENLSLHTTYNRVAHMLLYYSTRFGSKTKSGTKILLPLTHETMASLLGVTRETISHCMVTFHKEDLTKPGQFIVIPDVERLRSAAYDS